MSRIGAATMRTLLVAALLGLTSCASPTPYQPMTDGQGYAQQQLEENRYRVTFSGNTATPRETVENYLLYRAAEVTVERGYDYFVLADNQVERIARAIRGERRGIPEARVREEVVRYGGDVLETLRGWFRPLEVIASLAPLLGLFGTVLGMIEAFRQLETAGNQVNPAILSGGIWEALQTTAVGLAVAMPAVIALNWLERRVDRLAHEMDNVVTQVFTEDLSDQPEEGHSRAPANLRPAAAGD